MVLDLRLSKDWVVGMTILLFLEEDYSNFDINNEDDKAIMDIFNSIPD